MKKKEEENNSQKVISSTGKDTTSTDTSSGPTPDFVNRTRDFSNRGVVEAILQLSVRLLIYHLSSSVV